jgi:hypothetical protein
MGANLSSNKRAEISAPEQTRHRLVDKIENFDEENLEEIRASQFMSRQDREHSFRGHASFTEIKNILDSINQGRYKGTSQDNGLVLTKKNSKSDKGLSDNDMDSMVMREEPPQSSNPDSHTFKSILENAEINELEGLKDTIQNEISKRTRTSNTPQSLNSAAPSSETESKWRSTEAFEKLHSQLDLYEGSCDLEATLVQKLRKTVIESELEQPSFDIRTATRQATKSLMKFGDEIARTPQSFKNTKVESHPSPFSSNNDVKFPGPSNQKVHSGKPSRNSLPQWKCVSLPTSIEMKMMSKWRKELIWNSMYATGAILSILPRDGTYAGEIIGDRIARTASAGNGVTFVINHLGRGSSFHVEVDANESVRCD